MDHDDKGIDMFMAAWSLSTEPSPRGMYSETNPMNDSRFATKENNKLLNDEAYIVPLTNSYSIQAVNSKLVNYSLEPSVSNSMWYKVGYAK